MSYKMPKVKNHGKLFLLMLWGITVEDFFFLGSLQDVALILEDMFERGLITEMNLSSMFA